MLPINFESNKMRCSRFMYIYVHSYGTYVREKTLGTITAQWLKSNKNTVVDNRPKNTLLSENTIEKGCEKNAPIPRGLWTNGSSSSYFTVDHREIPILRVAWKPPVKELSGAISLQTSSACVPVKIQLPHANWINLCNKGIREVNQPLGRALEKNEYKLFFSGRGKLFRQVTCVFSVTQGIK